MKNLLNKFTIEELEESSFKESLRGDLNNSFYRKYYRYGRYNINGIHIWSICDRILKNNINKSFSLAFHYYCTLVPKEWQYYFLDKFSNSIRRMGAKYIIDDNGLIQINKESLWHKYNSKREQIVFTSFNTKYGYVCNRDGTIIEVVGKYYDEKNSDYKYKIIEGFTQEFKSKNNSLYKRLRLEDSKAKRKKDREEKRKRKEIEYSFLSQSEIQNKKEKEADSQKILKHGFDLITSFRTEKQTNPDLIKLKQ